MVTPAKAVLFGQHLPLASRPQNIDNAVHHFAKGNCRESYCVILIFVWQYGAYPVPQLVWNFGYGDGMHALILKAIAAEGHIFIKTGNKLYFYRFLG